MKSGVFAAILLIVFLASVVSGQAQTSPVTAGQGTAAQIIAPQQNLQQPSGRDVIANSQALLQAGVAPTTQKSSAVPSGSSASTSRTSSAPVPQAKTSTLAATRSGTEDSLPPASSSLPILSIVGFGVLVGGVISAMRTR